MSEGPSRQSRKWHQILFLYYHTLLFLRPNQLIHRPLSLVKFSLYQLSPWFWERVYLRANRSRTGNPRLRKAVLLGGLRENGYPPLIDQSEILDRSERILRGEFAFLNHSRVFSQGVDWNCESVSHLWRYQLHYFNYAWDLGVSYRLSRDERFRVGFKCLVESWIDQNRLGQLDGWHPYTISVRAVNWIYAYYLFGSLFEEERRLRGRFLRSLYLQCDFLFHNLEYQGYGNHLMANIKGLIFGGVFFEDSRSERWLRTGLRLLRQEMEEQILGDGGHFERSPMYHLIVMKDLIECLSLLRSNGMPAPPGMVSKLKAMADFARGIAMPGGQIPLLNDSTYDLVPDAEELIATARHLCGQQGEIKARSFSRFLLGPTDETPVDACEGAQLRAVPFRDTGYFVLRSSEGSALILDCGPVCPDYLPPHAHADTLGYEFWLEGRAMITDTGVSEYGAGPWRDFQRSTRAHNTVAIDGQDQSEVWGSFRVARRAFPRDIVWIANGDVDYFSGGHDGYRRLKRPVYHQRRVLRFGHRFWLILDQIRGRGTHQAESFVHLHPECAVDRAEHDMVRVSRDEGTMSVCFFDYDALGSSSGKEDPLQGWYSPEFGVRLPRQTFCMTKSGATPFFLGYLLVSGEVGRFSVSYEIGGIERYLIQLDSSRWEVEVHPSDSSLRVREHAEGTQDSGGPPR